MQTTAQLQSLLGTLHALAAGLIARAERIDVQRDFADMVKTKFRSAKPILMQRSRLLRQQAGEVFGRIDTINAVLEFRARQESEGRMLVSHSLSYEARQALKEEIGIVDRGNPVNTRIIARHGGGGTPRVAPPTGGFRWKENQFGSGAWVAIA